MMVYRHIARLIPLERGALFGPFYSLSTHRAHADCPSYVQAEVQAKNEGCPLLKHTHLRATGNSRRQSQVLAPSFSSSSKQHQKNQATGEAHVPCVLKTPALHQAFYDLASPINSNMKSTLLTCWISVRYLAVLSVILKYSQSSRSLNLIYFVSALPVGLPPRSPCSATKRDSSAIALPPLIYTSPWSLSTQDVAAEKRCQSWSSAVTIRLSSERQGCCQGSGALASPLAALSETAI
jgi:hypothetical protein